MTDQSINNWCHEEMAQDGDVICTGHVAPEDRVTDDGITICNFCGAWVCSNCGRSAICCSAAEGSGSTCVELRKIGT